MTKLKMISAGVNLIDQPSRYELEANPNSKIDSRAFSLMIAVAAASYEGELHMTRTRVSGKPGLELDGPDRARLLSEIAIAQSERYDRIVVTTGIDNICALSHEARAAFPHAKVPVIFTCAQWPEIHDGESDRLDNLSMATLKQAAPGVYIAVGKVFADASSVQGYDPQRKVFTLVHEPA